MLKEWKFKKYYCILTTPKLCPAQTSLLNSRLTHATSYQVPHLNVHLPKPHSWSAPLPTSLLRQELSLRSWWGPFLLFRTRPLEALWVFSLSPSPHSISQENLLALSAGHRMWSLCTTATVTLVYITPSPILDCWRLESPNWSPCFCLFPSVYSKQRGQWDPIKMKSSCVPS